MMDGFNNCRSAGVNFYNQLDFPTVLICPMTKKNPVLYVSDPNQSHSQV
jgi:hypothetical protein